LTDKKKLDEELENEIRKVNQKYESMTLPLFEKVFLLKKFSTLLI